MLDSDTGELEEKISNTKARSCGSFIQLSFTDCAMVFGSWAEMSMPASFITSFARGYQGAAFGRRTRYIKLVAREIAQKTSAIKLRVALPVERNKTFGLCLAIIFRFHRLKFADILESVLFTHLCWDLAWSKAVPFSTVLKN
jgi:hypothetical protein